MYGAIVVLCLCAVGIGFWCAISDICARKIPNIAILVLVVLSLIHSLIGGVWINWLHLLVAIVIGVVVYLLRCFGAGDVKYFWACMLFVPDQIETLLIGTALAGLVLAIVYLARHRFRPKEVGTLPYGVAISTGLALCLCKAMF